MTRREMLIFLLFAVAMIAAGLTWIFGPWGLIGSGTAVLIGVPIIIDEREEAKTDA
jgi:hypothetical protein